MVPNASRGQVVAASSARRRQQRQSFLTGILCTEQVLSEPCAPRNVLACAQAAAMLWELGMDVAVWGLVP